MRIITRLAMLAIIGGVASCSGMASEPSLNPKPEATSLKLISAERTTGHCGNPGVSWEASSATVSRLESALLNNPWVSITEFALNGERRGVARSWCGKHRITCTFSSGRVLVIFVEERKTIGLVDGDSFRLNIPASECRQILDLSEWDEIEARIVVDELKSESEEAVGLSLSPPVPSFESCLAHDREDEPAVVVSAIRSVSNLEASVDGSNQSNPILVKARGVTLRQLEDAVQGRRQFSIMLTMDGDVLLLERDEEPSEQIICAMSDGQTVVVNVFASDGAWCIAGEGPFRLALWADEGLELLKPAGWEAVD